MNRFNCQARAGNGRARDSVFVMGRIPASRELARGEWPSRSSCALGREKERDLPFCALFGRSIAKRTIYRGRGPSRLEGAFAKRARFFAGLV